MEKALVIGANGFIGTKLSKKLAKEGYDVVAFVDKRYGYDALSGLKNIKMEEFTLEDIESLYNKPYLDGVDTIYNMAWAGVNANMRNAYMEQLKNVEYYLKVLLFAEHHGIQRVIVPGSASEVSCGEGIITGHEVPAPSDIYSSAKVAARYMSQTFARQHGISLVWTLITSLYGPGRDDNSIIPYTIKKLLSKEKPSFTGLEQQWDFMYVDDLITAFIALGNKGVGGKIYPIGSGEHRQIREYVEIIRNLIDPTLPLGIGDLPYKNSNKIDNQIMDISNLVLDTGFKANYSFEEGINETINSYK